MGIKNLKIKDLTPADYNPRKITDKEIAMLKKSLHEYGDLSGIVFNRRTGVLIGGHQRLKCLPPDAVIDKKEMLEPTRTGTVATGYIYFDGEQHIYREVDWPAEKEKQANIAANQHGGEFDLKLLDNLIFDIMSTTPELDTDLLGLDTVLVENILNELKKAGTNDPDEIPVVQGTASTQPGDLYVLGKHRLLCGDSTKKENINILMGGARADMVFTDPPYNVSIHGLGNATRFDKKLKRNVKTTNGIGQIHDEFMQASGEMSTDEFISFLAACFTLLIEATRDGSIHYICMDWRHIKEMTTAAEVYTEFKNLCVWNKDNAGMGSFYRSKHELVFVYKKGTVKHVNNFMLGESGRYRTNVWDYPAANSFAAKQTQEESKKHPTCKPVKMVADAIMDCSHRGDIILDVFLGYGSTLIASEDTGRRCYGMEILPAYCDAIVTRYVRFAGNKKITKNGVEIEWPC